MREQLEGQPGKAEGGPQARRKAVTSLKNSGAMMSACPRLGYMISFPRGSRNAVSANISGVQKSSWAPQITSVSVWMSSSRSRTLKASSARSTAIVSVGFSS